jgi:hypothetical protein
VLWVSDLYQPAVDPDDHYDLAVATASSRPPSMIVLDNHLNRQRDEAPAVADLAAVVERPAPPVVLDRDIEAQLALLRQAPQRSVTIVSLGGLTAIAHLLDVDAVLLARKVNRILIFAGDAGLNAPLEYNVALDPAAFVRVMTSRLPVRWVPCFDGGAWRAGTSSYTVSSDATLLNGVRGPVRRWFNTYLGDRYGVRNLWAGPIAIGEQPVGARWRTVTVHVGDDGVLRASGHSAHVQELVVQNREAFTSWMVDSSNAYLRRL